VAARAALRRPSPTLVKLRGPSRTRARRSRVGIGSTRPVRRSSPLGHSICAPSLSRSFGRPSLDFRSPTEHTTGDPCRPAGFPAGRTTLPLVDFCCPTTQSRAGGYVHRQRIPPPPRATCGVWLPPSRLLPPALPTLARRSVHGLAPSRSSPRRNRCPSRGPYPPAVTCPRSRRPEGLHSCEHGRLQGLAPATSPFRRQDHE
jgi:hypothetical protein